MRDVAANNDFNWLKGLDLKREALGAILVKTIIPQVFDRYFAVMPNYGIIDDFPFDKYPEDISSISNLNKRHEIDRQFGLFLNQNVEHLFQPVTIKDIASRFGVDYSRYTLNEIKQTSGVVPLPKRSIASYTKLLNELLESETYLFIDDYYRDLDEELKQQMIVTSAGEYIDFLESTSFDYCSYLFPSGHKWCLVTFEDINCLVFACDNETSERIANIAELELFELSPNDTLY